LELDRGRGYPYEGNYSNWLEAKEKRLEMESKSEASHQKAMKDELEWVRSNAKGRQSKSKARLARFDELSSQEFQNRNETNEIYIPPGERLGDLVVEINDVSKGFDGRQLINGFSANIPKGAIVGIVGGNGMGKSTLFRMIAGEEKPDGGSIRLGETVKLAFVEQGRDESLNDNNTVWQEISDGHDILKIGSYEVGSRNYIGRFNFKGGDQQKFVKDLSGGERNRLHLAKVLKQGANVIMLDEPTNDLDVETLRALEEAVLAFPGCMMIISHDRWFLDRVTTHIMAYEDDGSILFMEGNYTDYEEDRRQRFGDTAALVPAAGRHKKF
jgi:ATPase subunit of ABC transporter with duplicated ATPase domains